MPPENVRNRAASPASLEAGAARAAPRRPLAHGRPRQVVEAADELGDWHARRGGPSTVALCPVSADALATSPGAATVISNPAHEGAAPEVGSASVVRMRTAVVLPAPL